MEINKSNKGLISVLAIIIVLLLCVIGYLLFGRDVLNSKTNDTSRTTTTTTSTTEVDKTIYMVNTDVLTETELQTNYKNLIKQLNNIQLEYKCTFFEEHDCFNHDITVDGKIVIEEDMATLGNHTIFKTDKYYVVELYNDTIGVYSLDFYTSDGNHQLKISNGYGNTPITTENSIMYFTEYNIYDNKPTELVKYSVDLSKSKLEFNVLSKENSDFNPPID